MKKCINNALLFIVDYVVNEYNCYENWSHFVINLPWSHNMLLIKKIKDMDIIDENLNLHISV